MVYIFLAEGFEDVEALTVVDLTRRAGIEIKIISVSGNLDVTSSHGVTVRADCLFENIDNWNDGEMFVLPGGMPGALNLRQHNELCDLLKVTARQAKRIAAICAAPFVLGDLGLLEGKRATCYPGFESHLKGATYTATFVECDGNIITGKGPAAAMDFGFEIVRQLKGQECVYDLKKGMLFL